MAEAFLNHFYPDAFIAESAGLEPGVLRIHSSGISCEDETPENPGKPRENLRKMLNCGG
jgi:hypothetical protein